MRRPALLAVDAGGSKVDAALVRRSGEVLGAARYRTSEHEGTGTEEHLSQVVLAVEAAARDAGLDPDARPLAELGMYCLAGADLPADDRRIGRWLHRARLSDTGVVRNDTFAVLRAGTDRSWGVGVVCGYGINCCGIGPTGRVTRFPAIGDISGDWGGGADLGATALWHAIRAQDGRGPKTALARTLPPRFGLRTPRQVMEALYFGRADERRIVDLAPLVFEAAANTDAVATQIVDRQADEIALMATVAIRRLRMQHLDPDVVLGGGIFRNELPSFFSRIERQIHTVAPAARIKRLTAPPLIGAVLLGLDALGATRSAHTEARSALTHRRLDAHASGRRRKE